MGSKRIASLEMPNGFLQLPQAFQAETSDAGSGCALLFRQPGLFLYRQGKPRGIAESS